MIVWNCASAAETAAVVAARKTIAASVNPRRVRRRIASPELPTATIPQRESAYEALLHRCSDNEQPRDGVRTVHIPRNRAATYVTI